jgi:hypothetical protein
VRSDTRSGGGTEEDLIHRFDTPSPRTGKRVIYECATHPITDNDPETSEEIHCTAIRQTTSAVVT